MKNGDAGAARSRSIYLVTHGIEFVHPRYHTEVGRAYVTSLLGEWAPDEWAPDSRPVQFPECRTRRPASHCPCGQFPRLLWLVDETEWNITVEVGENGRRCRHSLGKYDFMLSGVDPEWLWQLHYDDMLRRLEAARE